MLMITPSRGNDQARTLKLAGKLIESWIVELERACGESLLSPERLCLDLCDLTYVDGAGARFLTGLMREGARVVGCSAFVAEMLRQSEC
jgi:ABC-type transporter Mla MlaB component